MGKPLTSLVACERCPRLAAYLAEARAAHPDWHGRPVPASGPADAPLLIVGLAPGYRGANRTGVPFVGDSSGEWLTEHRVCARVTNVVKCCPPENKPTAAEVRTCREAWFDAEIAASPARVIVALGRLAHDALVRAPFAHGAIHARADGRVVIDSFHPSPLNTRTGRLSRAAFDSVFVAARARLA